VKCKNFDRDYTDYFCVNLSYRDDLAVLSGWDEEEKVKVGGKWVIPTQKNCHRLCKNYKRGDGAHSSHD